MFLEHLSTISGRIEGAIALSLVDRDGMPVESVSASPELDLEAIAAELISQVRAISQQQQELSVGEVQQFTEMPNHRRRVTHRSTSRMGRPRASTTSPNASSASRSAW